MSNGLPLSSNLTLAVNKQLKVKKWILKYQKLKSSK
jgi:hypothetical protein